MIDWPNVISGFILGVVVTGVFWLADRMLARSAKKRDALDSWRVATSVIELQFYKQPPMTSGSLHVILAEYPIDRWRRILGPDEFRVLERLQRALSAHEHFARRVATGVDTQADRKRLEEAERERKAAFQTFANISRQANSKGYSELVIAEQRAELRREYVRHPVKTWIRERRNKQG